jgi:eukaryotic-like serine/threonine-protein kinase
MPMKADDPGKSIELACETDLTVGDLHIRPSLREVVSARGTEVLEPRVMKVLVALVRNAGEVVSRNELVQQCWDGRVVGDDAVSRCITRLRRLGELHCAFSVDTIARVGYRLSVASSVFAAPSVAAPDTSAEAGIVDVHTTNADPWPFPATGRREFNAVTIACVAALLLVGLYLAATQWQKFSRSRPDESQAIAEVIALVDKDQYGEAFTRARPLVAGGWLENDAGLSEAWRQLALPMRPLIAEDGATVFFKPYDDLDGEWMYAGVTPFAAPVDAPYGTLRLKVTKPGFRTGYFAIANPGPSVVNDPPNRIITQRGLSRIPLPLIRDGSLGDDMVLVPETHIPVFLSGWTTDMNAGNHEQKIPAFAIARHEVTNQEFKEFIDAGGYDEPAYWAGLRFQEKDRELTWAAARAKFVDATGRPGPSTWQLSTYPPAQAEFPVSGISWYEAMAYARFRKRSLPTIHHWVRAALGPYDPHFNAAPRIAASSRFSSEGPASAREEVGLGPWGTYHMAGNVREWVLNSTGTGAALGLALGGAWSDYASESQTAQSEQPMSRLPSIGMRLMQTFSGNTPDESLLEPIELIVDRAGPQRAPVSEDAFDAMRFQFTAGHGKPNDILVTEVERTPLWIAEEISLTFSGDESATLYIVRPRVARNPLQPVIFGPANDCCSLKRPNRKALDQLFIAGFIVNSGRALVMPIWFGSYERVEPANPDPAATADRQRRSALGWERDLGIVLDYLETRADLDPHKVGYFGFSRGAAVTSITLALEPTLNERVKAAVLLSGGIELRQTLHPMIDMINYAPRIKMPVLMINGRFDHHYPYGLSQRRMFELLGTAPDQKQHVVYDTGHFSFPPNSVARDTSNWFDRYLGVAR